MNNKKNKEQELKAKEPSIELDLDRGIQEIYADRDRMDQMLFNIINNAIKFTSKGKIRIETRRLLVSMSLSSSKEEVEKVEIKISDTGSGIHKDILPHLFSKFVTKSPVATTTRIKGYGIGLGLYISKAIVTAHSGEISAYNNDSGGATFDIVLPVYQKERRSGADDDG